VQSFREHWYPAAVSGQLFDSVLDERTGPSNAD